MAIRVRVISKLHPGYLRACLAIAPGESELVVSALQCAALEGDPRLVVVRLDEDVAEPAPAADRKPAPDAAPAAGDLDHPALGELNQTTEKPASAKGKAK